VVLSSEVLSVMVSSLALETMLTMPAVLPETVLTEPLALRSCQAAPSQYDALLSSLSMCS
jgi:hypothetical protein